MFKKTLEMMKLNREIRLARRAVLGPDPLYPTSAGYILIQGSVNGSRTRDDERTVIMRKRLNVLLDQKKQLQNS